MPLKPFFIVLAAAFATSAQAEPICDAPLPCATAQPSGKPFLINGGERLSKALEDYAIANGWTVVWNVQQDWIAPGLTTFRGDFMRASEDFIHSLVANGVDVHARYFTGNKTLVVFGTGGGHE